MKKDLLNQNGKLLLSYPYLKGYVKAKTIEQAVSRKRISPENKVNRIAFFNYESLPTSWHVLIGKTKSELLALASAGELDSQTEFHYKQISHLQAKSFVKYREHYQATYDLKGERLLKVCQLRAVWDYVSEENANTGKLEPLYCAFNKLYPGKYSSKHSFANALAKLKESGVDAVCVDARIFTAPKNVKRISADCQFWTECLISMGSKPSNREVWRRLKSYCIQAGREEPSLSWVAKYRKEILRRSVNVFNDRNGVKEATKKMPHVSTHHAQRVNDQWQMDGWTLPFWGEKFQRYTVVLVRDSFSKMVIGSAFGKSENTLLIMEALQKAISFTNCLPFEIVTDNHAFNQTKEAAYFKEGIEAYGCKWTVDMNPQRKSIIERYNRHLDGYCRNYYGYLGESIKAKRIDARPKQELIDEYAKPANHLSENEISAIRLAIVNRFNTDYKSGEGKAPLSLYQNSDKSHCVTLTLFDRVKILTPKTKKLIRRGQISIVIGGMKHEYQLPADLYDKYNDCTVVVRYEDLRESIYLYDFTTDEFISELKNKPKIFGAIANQSETDIRLLNQHKGRLEGIKAKDRKRQQQLLKDALKENPEAVNLINQITVHKDVIREIEQDANLKRQATEEGINPDKLPIRAQKSYVNIEALILPSKKEKHNHYQPKNHTASIVNNINDLDE